MRLYRIYTENKNLKGIKGILNQRFDSYTLFEGVGSWEGIEEKSLIIELSDKPENAVNACALAIKRFNNQQAVLVTVSEAESKLI